MKASTVPRIAEVGEGQQTCIWPAESNAVEYLSTVRWPVEWWLLFHMHAGGQRHAYTLSAISVFFDFLSLRLFYTHRATYTI